MSRKKIQYSTAYRTILEPLEGRTMLSITDPVTGFGRGGIVSPFPASAYSGKVFVASDGDLIDTVEAYTPGFAATPPAYSVQISDVSSNGQLRWTGTIQESESQYNLIPEAATQLPNGDVVIAVLQDYGNSGDQYLYEFDPSGNQVTSFTTNFGHTAGAVDAQSAITAILPRSDGSMLLFNSNDGSYNLQPVAADGTPGGAWPQESFGPTSTTISRSFIPYQQSDGKIVVAGIMNSGDVHYLALQRLDADGSLDSIFGSDGTVLQPGLYTPVAMQETSDGKIVVATDATLDYTSVFFCFDASGAHASFGADGAESAPSRVQITALSAPSGQFIYAAGTRYGQPYLMQLYAAGAIHDAGVGSSEPLLVGDSGSVAAVFSDGSLLFSNDAGTLQKTVGLSVSQPTDDTTPPTATLGRLRRVPVDSPFYYIDVTYTDSNSGVDTHTLGTGNIVLKYGRNRTLFGQLVPPTTQSTGQVTAEFALPAPSGEWNQNDIGTYTIETAADEVTDNAGNGVPLQVLGSFTIKREATAANTAFAAPNKVADISELISSGDNDSWLDSASNPLR